mgnify:FL=1
MQWEVGNGGFAQAAENVLDWMPYALHGYLALNNHDGALLIQKALDIVSNYKIENQSMFDALEALDEEMNTDWWEVDTARVAYVRENSEAFLKIKWE